MIMLILFKDKFIFYKQHPDVNFHSTAEPFLCFLSVSPSSLYIYILFKYELFLFSEGLLKSQYPVFSMFGWKICIPKGACSRAWSAEVIQSTILKSASSQVSNHSSDSLEECHQRCLSETEFNCR